MMEKKECLLLLVCIGLLLNEVNGYCLQKSDNTKSDVSDKLCYNLLNLEKTTVGQLCVSFDGTDQLVFQAAITATVDFLELDHGHLSVLESLELTPQTRTGSPVIHQYQYYAASDDREQLTFRIPLQDIYGANWVKGTAECLDRIFFSFQAAISQIQEDGTLLEDQMWAEGTYLAYLDNRVTWNTFNIHCKCQTEALPPSMCQVAFASQVN